MDNKRYVIKVYDRETGAEYEFDGDRFDHNSEKGIKYAYSAEKEALEILEPNGQERHCFRIWDGFDKWEEFSSEISVDGN